MTQYTAAVLTVSDTASTGQRKDASGDLLAELLQAAGFRIAYREVVPDERPLIRNALLRLSATREIDCILTTGGTGIAPRDVTPEATREVLDRVLPGIPEAMRAQSQKHTPFAMIARQEAGICEETLIVNLPGSVKAVRECFAVIEPVLHHVTDLIHGRTHHQDGDGNN